MRKSNLLVQMLVCTLLAVLSALAVAQAPSPAAMLERGRYLVVIGHCNNCHTSGYTAAAGKIPEDRWLMGNPIGWRSKKGTTYATNLRLYVQNLSEEGWLQVARTAQSRAPMPWWSLRDTSEDDLKAMYRYIRSLAPLGEPAPSYLPPDQVPPRPYQQLPDMS